MHLRLLGYHKSKFDPWLEVNLTTVDYNAEETVLVLALALLKYSLNLATRIEQTSVKLQCSSRNVSEVDF